MPSTKKLVYFEKWIDPIAEVILGGRSDIHLDRLSCSAPVEETSAKIKQAHGYQMSLCCELRGSWPVNAELLRQAPNLLAIASEGSGVAAIDIDACTAAGVIVCHQGGSSTESVAQHTVGMILNLAKRITMSSRAMLLGQLDRAQLTGNDLGGKVLGIVGLGRIGTRTARLCTEFGMRVIAFDPYLTETEIARRGALKVEFPELLRSSDFISVHCPLNRETMNLFGAAEFSNMKRCAYFINTAHAETHDEHALANAVADGHIAGAGVDALLDHSAANEHPLLRQDRVIATPNIAGMTHESKRNTGRQTADQWIDIFSGAVPPRLVNPQAWPRYSNRFNKLLGFNPQSPEK